jgi:iron complex transport system substrate-binding protein
MRIISFLFALTILVCSCGDVSPDSKEQTARIVSTAGVLTETLYALGWGDRLVAVDVTSTYPASVKALTSLGHATTITAESILSQRPTHLFALTGSIKQELVDRCKQAGVQVHLLETPTSVEAAQSLITQLGEITQQQEKAKALIDEMLLKLPTPNTIAKNVLFIYSRGAANLMVSGKETPVSSMIELAGAHNAITEFTGYKPLSAEYALKTQPDVVLFFETGFSAIGGLEGCLEHPILGQMEAIKNNRIISMDGGLLSSFGPRTAEAAIQLNTKLNALP